MENKDQIIHAINALNARVTQKTDEIRQDPDALSRNLVMTLATSGTALIADTVVSKSWGKFSESRGWDTGKLFNRLVAAGLAGAASAAVSVLVGQTVSAIFARKARK